MMLLASSCVSPRSAASGATFPSSGQNRVEEADAGRIAHLHCMASREMISTVHTVSIMLEGEYTRLQCEQWVPRPLEEVFAFFADATNLERITPPFLRFHVRSMSTPTIQCGTEISYRLHLHGLPISWTSRIEDWEPPYRFTDVQIHGPFRLWHHDHEFISEQGGTCLRDTVHYRAPFARLQRILRLSWVERDLEQIFHYRQQVIERLFDDTLPQTSTHSC